MIGNRLNKQELIDYLVEQDLKDPNTLRSSMLYGWVGYYNINLKELRFMYKDRCNNE